MSLLSFFSSDKESLTALVDVGSSSVGVALVKESKVVFTARTDAKLESEYDFARYQTEITKALEQSLTAALGSKNGVPHQYVCFLSSPFYLAQTRVVKYEEQTVFTFTPKLYEYIIAEEVDRFKTDYSASYPNQGSGEFLVLENKTMQIKLNGYEVDKPFGQKTFRAELAQYVSGTSGSLVKQLRDTIIKASHHDKIEFHSFVFAAFSHLRDHFGAKASFLIVDVSGELTDVTVVTDGVISETASFPLGKNTFVRQTANLLKTAYAEADSLLRLHFEGGSRPAENRQLDETIAKIKEDWLSQMREALSGALKNNILPERAYIIGTSADAKIFMSWLAAGDFKDFTFSNRPLDIKYLNDDLLNPEKDHQKSTTDAFLLLELCFYDKIKR